MGWRGSKGGMCGKEITGSHGEGEGRVEGAGEDLGWVMS